MWHMGTLFRGDPVGFDDLKGLFQPQPFHGNGWEDGEWEGKWRREGTEEVWGMKWKGG